jgi:hypothetical protein
VALVSKRLCEVCHAPELLRQLDIKIHGASKLMRTQALLAWLPRHGSRVRSLSLSVYGIGEEAADRELAGTFNSCLHHCCAASQLEQLSTGRGILPSTASWMPHMSSLCSLHIIALQCMCRAYRHSPGWSIWSCEAQVWSSQRTPSCPPRSH